MSKLWKNTNLGLLSITVGLTVWALLGSQVTSCADTDDFINFCTVSLNVWGITDAGYKELVDNVPAGALIVDATKVCTLVHFILSFIAYLLYVLDMRISAALTTTVGHFAGWVLIGIVVTETPGIAAIVDALSVTDYSSTEFVFGNAVIASMVATSMQLLVVASTFVHILVFERQLFSDFIYKLD